jgi:hypothetical protein
MALLGVYPTPNNTPANVLGCAARDLGWVFEPGETEAALRVIGACAPKPGHFDASSKVCLMDAWLIKNTISRCGVKGYGAGRFKSSERPALKSLLPLCSNLVPVMRSPTTGECGCYPAVPDSPTFPAALTFQLNAAIMTLSCCFSVLSGF